MNTRFFTNEIHYQSSEYRPGVHGILIPGKRGKLMATLYSAGGAGVHPTILLLHGIPVNEQNEDIAQALRRNGFHVLTFHYSGCFGSEGNYALTHNIEDADAVLDYILKDSLYGFDKEQIFAVGHSMGGFVCGQITAKRKEIKGAVFLMPCDIGRIWQIGQENSAELEKIKNLLGESADWLQGASKENFLTELAKHSEEFRLESLANRLAEKPILCIEASLDTHTLPRHHCAPFENAVFAISGTKLKSLSFETDHFASDYRLEVTRTVVDYLAELLNKGSI